MACTIARFEYFYTTIMDQPGKANKLLFHLFLVVYQGVDIGFGIAVFRLPTRTG